ALPLAILVLTAAGLATAFFSDGYTPFVVAITSHGGACRIDLDADLGSQHARMTVDVPAETRVMRTLLVPALGAGMRSSVQLHASGSIGGRDFSELVTATSTTHGFRDLDLAVIDPHEDFPLTDARAAAKSKLTAPRGSPKVGGGWRGSGSTWVESRIERIPAESMPDRWQGLPVWLTVLLTPAGEAALTAGQRQALAVWSGAGGAILVTDPRQLAGWSALGTRATVVEATSPGLTRRIQATNDVAEFSPTRFPVPGTERVPVLGFVVLAVVFAVLVGPVNLWWVRRRKALHLFLLTTPLISLATCVSLVVVGLFAEGLGVKRASTQFAILDQAHGRVVAWSGATYFSGLAIGRIAIDAEDRLATMDDRDFSTAGYHQEPQPLTVDWGDGQRLSGSLIPARVNRQLAYASVRPEKRRLILERDGGGWKLTNGLGVAIIDLVWLDDTGAGWQCARLADGAVARLASVAWTPPLKPARSERLGSDTVLAWDAVLPPGDARNVFYARLSAPFIPIPGPAGSETTPCEIELIGPLAAPAAPAAAPSATPAAAPSAERHP
ncbi:MAG: hypothetical protein H0W83_11670, partial [Planctomycetes bacterium]|nr:hypothetical protein [Planctomycetota bacterium]